MDSIFEVIVKFVLICLGLGAIYTVFDGTFDIKSYLKNVAGVFFPVAVILSLFALMGFTGGIDGRHQGEILIFAIFLLTGIWISWKYIKENDDVEDFGVIKKHRSVDKKISNYTSSLFGQNAEKHKKDGEDGYYIDYDEDIYEDELEADDAEDAYGFNSNRNIRENTSTKKPTQDLYATRRPVQNWSEIQNRRAEIGESGELIVLEIEKEYLTSIGKEDLADDVRHVSKESDGYGYDILSFFETGEEKFIEVKSTTSTKTNRHKFYMSRNEFTFLQHHPISAFIYLVYLSEEVPEIEVRTSSQVQDGEITPTSFQIEID